MRSLIQWNHRSDNFNMRRVDRVIGETHGDFWINIYKSNHGAAPGWYFTIRSSKYGINTVLSSETYTSLEEVQMISAKWAFINLFLILNQGFVERFENDKNSNYSVRGFKSISFIHIKHSVSRGNTLV